MIPQPLFVLAPPYGEASRVAGLFGAHPQALLMPELHLTMAGTIGGLLDVFNVAAAGHEDGLYRAVAAVFCGGQSVASVEGAKDWLARRADRGSETVLEEICERLAPRQLVVPVTTACWRPDTLRLLDAMFPGAPWLHVRTHPRLYCAVAVPQLKDRLYMAPDYRDYRIDTPPLDPQLAWLRVHINIDRAVAARRSGRSLAVRAEQLYAEPEATLAPLCTELGWDASAAALEAMLHPERSVFAEAGPEGAIWGLEEDFIREPEFVRRLRPLVSLDGALEWRKDGLGFGEEVKQLANGYGYR